MKKNKMPPAARPHCVGGHLQSRGGIRRFKQRIASTGILNTALSSALDPPQKLLINKKFLEVSEPFFKKVLTRRRQY